MHVQAMEDTEEPCYREQCDNAQNDISPCIVAALERDAKPNEEEPTGNVAVASRICSTHRTYRRRRDDKKFVVRGQHLSRQPNADEKA